MADKNPTAYELFQRFAPKFREVMWKPTGLVEGSMKYGFHPTNMSPVTYYRYHHLNIQEAGLEFVFAYDKTSAVDPITQMVRTCWTAILEGPFRGRKFYADPVENEIDRMFDGLGRQDYGKQVHIVFSHDGDPIPGLVLETTMKVNSWTFFVPEGSLEGQAIAAALKFEQAKYRQEKLRSEEQTFPTVEACSTALQQCMADLPA
jgi:hypothetical protein